MEVSYRLQDLAFEWDGKKASSNVEKHGVTFEEVIRFGKRVTLRSAVRKDRS